MDTQLSSACSRKNDIKLQGNEVAFVVVAGSIGARVGTYCVTKISNKEIVVERKLSVLTDHTPYDRGNHPGTGLFLSDL